MLVSVIIPMYNRESTIKDAAMSVLNQTHKDLELIIVDDCSKDNSVAVVNEMAKEDSRVRLIKSEKNGGACVARNIGIDNAKGEIIAFQDSDDMWHADKLEKCIKAIEEQDADFVFSALTRDEIIKGKKFSETIPVFNLNTEEDKFGRLLYQNYVSTQTIVAKRHIFEKVRFDKDFPRFQDWDFAIGVARCGFKIYYIPESLVDSEVLADSISYNGKKAVKALELMENKYKKEYEKRPDIYKKFCERAAFLIEMSGNNGTKYFENAYKTKKSFGGLVKLILAKLRLYRPLNKLVSKFM